MAINRAEKENKLLPKVLKHTCLQIELAREPLPGHDGNWTTTHLYLKMYVCDQFMKQSNYSGKAQAKFSSAAQLSQCCELTIFQIPTL